MELDIDKLKKEVLKELKELVGDTDYLNDEEFQDKLFNSSMKAVMEIVHKQTKGQIKKKIENLDIDKELKNYDGERTEFVRVGMNLFKIKLLTLLE